MVDAFQPHPIRKATYVLKPKVQYSPTALLPELLPRLKYSIIMYEYSYSIALTSYIFTKKAGNRSTTSPTSHTLSLHIPLKYFAEGICLLPSAMPSWTNIVFSVVTLQLAYVIYALISRLLLSPLANIPGPRLRAESVRGPEGILTRSV